MLIAERRNHYSEVVKLLSKVVSKMTAGRFVQIDAVTEEFCIISVISVSGDIFSAIVNY